MKHPDLEQIDPIVSVTNPLGQPATVVDCRKAGSLSVASAFTVDANAAKTFATGVIGTNTITFASGIWKTGVVGQFTTTGGLPTGLSLATNYYVISLGSNVFSFATSYANAVAGTVVTFTATGASGTGTFTPTALATCSVIPQWSNDQVQWNNIGTSTSITTTGTYSYLTDRPPYPYFRLLYAIASGSLTLINTNFTSRDAA